jgi:GT2 family glycosyltransferase
LEKKSISVIIPNYNGEHLLKAYLPYTIAAVASAGVPYELIIVDDGSTDNSVLFIKKNFPVIKLIANPENKGFSFACNLGIRAAACELILLLNSDVVLTSGYFDQLWKYFSEPDTFGVMGRIIDMEGDHIQDAARVPKFNGFKLKTDYFYYTDSASDRLFTFYLSGANALVDASKLRALGGFNELFSPFYCEDMELSLRAWRLGWKCYYEHRAVCRHQVSASTKNYKTAAWVKSVYYRNRFYMHALHLDGLAALAWYAQVTIIDLLPRLLAGHTWIWKSYSGLFKNGQAISRSKKQFKNLMRAHHSRITIFDVVKKIRASVKNKTITRFAP